MGSFARSDGQYVPQLQIESHDKDSGFVIATWYTAFTLTDVVDILWYVMRHDNTPALGREHSHRWTIDGEQFTTLNNNMNDGDVHYLGLDYPTAIATNFGLNFHAVANYFGAGPIIFQTDSGGTGTMGGAKPVGGKTVTMEFRVDEAIQAGQQYRADVYYYKSVA